MIIRVKPAIIFLSAVSLSACATITPHAGFDTVQNAVTDRTGESIQWRTGIEADQQVTHQIKALLGKPLTKEVIVQIALLNNADLQAMYEELGVAQASMVQAGLLNNPIFSGELRYGSGGSSPSLELDVAQDFLSIFTVPLRKKMAAFEFEAAKLRLTSDVIDFVASVREAFYRAQASAQAVELMEEVTDSTGAMLKAAEVIFEAGNITELAVNRQRAVHAEARLMLTDTEVELSRDRERLNILMGLWGSDTSWKISRRLPTVPEENFDSQNIEKRVIENSLDLHIIRFNIEQLSTRLGLAKATSLVPDLEIGYSGEREDTDFENGVGLSLQIPIFDTGKAKRFGIQSELRKTQWMYISQAIKLRAASRNAVTELQQARAKTNHLFNVLLPLRQDIINGNMLHYNAMQVGVFDILMDQRRQIETGQQYITALKDYWLARARIEQLLSGSMTGSGMTRNNMSTAAPMAGMERGGH